MFDGIFKHFSTFFGGAEWGSYFNSVLQQVKISGIKFLSKKKKSKNKSLKRIVLIKNKQSKGWVDEINPKKREEKNSLFQNLF